MKTFNIGNDRSLKLSKNKKKITIVDNGTKKAAVFTPARCASFLLCLNEIDNQLCRPSQGEDVAYCNHYGEGLRWRMARVADERFSVRRPPKVLRAVRADDHQAHQDRHRDTPQRMANVQDGRRQSA